MNRYLWKQDIGGEVTQQTFDSELTSMSNLKSFLQEEFQNINSELKNIRQGFKDLHTCLLSIKGKLNGIVASAG